jgi:hypothetical protein
MADTATPEGEPTTIYDEWAAIEGASSESGDDPLGVQEALDDEPPVDEDGTEPEEDEGQPEDQEVDEAEGEEEGEEPESELEDVDLSETYTVKVRGEEFDVTVEELVAGYQRQDDYTRKTQELSAHRHKIDAYDRLEDALATDFYGTVEALAKSFGVDFAPSAQEPEDESAWDEIPASVRARLQQAEAAAAAAREQAQSIVRQQQITAEIERLRRVKQDPELDERELVEFAVAHRIGDLEAAYDAKAQREGRTVPKAEGPSVQRKRRAAKAHTPKRTKPSARSAVQEGSDDKMGLRESFKLAVDSLSR